MPDTAVRIYLYILISLSGLLTLAHGVYWIVQRRRDQPYGLSRKMVWREILFFITGLVGLYLFSARLLNNWLLMVAVMSMLVITVVLGEVLGPANRASALTVCSANFTNLA